MSGEIKQPYVWTIKQIFENKIFNIPVYQRPYLWSNENVEILLKDILKAFKENSIYYTGNIIICETDASINGIIRSYDIIDGQQRITTFVLILLALNSLFTKYVNNQNNFAVTNVIGKCKSILWHCNRTINLEKDLPSLKLNGLGKDAFKELYDYAFDNPDKLYDFTTKYDSKSNYDEIIMKNFRFIYKNLEQTICSNEDSLLTFVNFFIEKVRSVSIESTDRTNAFSIFESINSKGKLLEEIDKIKCYIFSELDENSYNFCLRQWGKLIIDTNDNLYDYLIIYIRAYIKYYRQNINLINFKTIACEEMQKYFNKKNLSDTFKALLEDMTAKVKFYSMLSNVNKLSEICKSSKLRLYFRIFSDNYSHPKALFFRTLVEYDNKKIKKDDLIEIVKVITIYMMQTLTLTGKDSKDLITMFVNIFDNIYEKGINLLTIKYFVAKDLHDKFHITKDDLKNHIIKYDAYLHKKISVPLLALYEAYDEKLNKVSYDQADVLSSKFSESFSLDHLLVQTPNPDDDNFKYYWKKDNDSLVLKAGSDFPEEIFDGMSYEDFKAKILNKFGNLRIYYKDKNSQRQNNAIELKDYGKFTKYLDIKNHERKLIDFFINKVLEIPELNYANKPKISSKTKLPRMTELIDEGLISLGDRIYLTINSEDSEAVLVSPSQVDYKGELITLNQWGLKITNWTSIQIYKYVCIVGETETLDEKRKRWLSDH